MANKLNQKVKSSVNQEKFTVVKRFLKTVSDENRLRILLAVKKDTLTVSEIYRGLGIAQNLTSHHISRLKNMGLLNEKREGTFRMYNMDSKKMKEYQKMFKELIED